MSKRKPRQSPRSDAARRLEALGRELDALRSEATAIGDDARSRLSKALRRLQVDEAPKNKLE